MILAQAYLCYFSSAIARRLPLSARGQGLVEYGLIIAVIAAAGIAGLAILGPKLQQTLTNVSSNMPGIQVTCTPAAGATIC